MSVNFDGIFSAFYRYRRDNIKKIVKVKASTTCNGRGDPYCVIDPEIEGTIDVTNWISEDVKNSSVTFTFLRDRISLSSYSFRSRRDTLLNMPLEWGLYGSNDKHSWKLIHHKENNQDFVTNGAEKNFPVNKTIPYSHIKIMQLGKNHAIEGDHYYFSFNKIEFFGTLHQRYDICTRRISYKAGISFSISLYAFIMS